MKSVGGVLISLSRPWARRWLNHWSLWRMVSATPYLRLPSQPQGITARWPVPNYTARWQRHMCVNNLPKVVTWKRNGRESNRDIRRRKSNALTTTLPGVCRAVWLIILSAWYTAFLHHYCYSTITAPFPSPFVTTIYKPSLLYFGFLTLPFFALFYSPSSFPPSPPHLPSFPLFPTPPTHAYNMPIQLHYIQLYRLCYPRRRLWLNVRPTSQRLDAFEMKGLRKILRVSWTAKKTNEWVLKKKRKATVGRCVGYMCNTVSTDDSDACNVYYFIYSFSSERQNRQAQEHTQQARNTRITCLILITVYFHLLAELLIINKSY